jgi:galactose mutarotase-like enzyme
MIILENEILRAAFDAKGAELQGLINKTTGLEYMWSGDAAYWGKHSPVLFPIVGGLKKDTYYYNGNAYQLPRHGFAREREFTAIQVNDTEALFVLQQDEQTAAVYPFAFELGLRYKLRDKTLSCTYEVYNPADKELLFSLGAHPAFAVPLVKGTHYTDYWLQFNVTETLQRWKLDNGLVASHAELLPTNNNRLPLDPALFNEDAIVLKHMHSNSITLGCTRHEHGIHFNFNDFPFFGIWAAKDAAFVCLEPWCGIADSVDHDQQLKNKEGINVLAPNASWERSWSVECF